MSARTLYKHSSLVLNTCHLKKKKTSRWSKDKNHATNLWRLPSGVGFRNWNRSPWLDRYTLPHCLMLHPEEKKEKRTSWPWAWIINIHLQTHALPSQTFAHSNSVLTTNSKPSYMMSFQKLMKRLNKNILKTSLSFFLTWQTLSTDKHGV